MNGITGQQLYDELAAAAFRAGTSLNKFISPLCSGRDRSWKMEQMRIAKVPTQLTIARVRALIAGEPLPEPKPSPRKGVPIARAHAEEAGGHRLNGDEIARRRSLADAAHAVRRPGETLQHAQARVRAGEDA